MEHRCKFTVSIECDGSEVRTQIDGRVQDVIDGIVELAAEVCLEAGMTTESKIRLADRITDAVMDRVIHGSGATEELGGQ